MVSPRPRRCWPTNPADSWKQFRVQVRLLTSTERAAGLACNAGSVEFAAAIPRHPRVRLCGRFFQDPLRRPFIDFDPDDWTGITITPDDEVARSVAGRGRSCRSDQEPSLTIRSVVGSHQSRTADGTAVGCVVPRRPCALGYWPAAASNRAFGIRRRIRRSGARCGLRDRRERSSRRLAGIVGSGR